LIYQTDGTMGLYYYTGSVWISLQNSYPPPIVCDISINITALSSTALEIYPNCTGTPPYSYQWEASANNQTTALATGLSPVTTYQATVTDVNGCTATASGTTQFNIGDTLYGGIVFYIAPTPVDLNGDGNLNYGLICALSDQSTGIQWNNGSNTTTGATGVYIGLGQGNTTTIVNNQGLGAYAAQLCDDLVLSGYSDWFLPSKEELYLMYTNLQLAYPQLGGFANFKYWSSTEYHYFFGVAAVQDFWSGSQGNYAKHSTFYVRAVRAF
ncbi:MAG: DUF1566 domain-containing protein, partial [Saprospiraceae bacterium]|nr:DUF1566 domain-containing protein [Saprospiraceae bacterium]